MAVLKSKDFPQIRKLVKLCGKFVVVKDFDVTHKKGRFSTRWRRPASQVLGQHNADMERKSKGSSIHHCMVIL